MIVMSETAFGFFPLLYYIYIKEKSKKKQSYFLVRGLWLKVFNPKEREVVWFKSKPEQRAGNPHGQEEN